MTHEPKEHAEGDQSNAELPTDSDPAARDAATNLPAITGSPAGVPKVFVTIDGKPVPAEVIGDSASELTVQAFTLFMRVLIQRGLVKHADQIGPLVDDVKRLGDALDVFNTPSVFDDKDKSRIEILERTAREHSFLAWLSRMGIDPLHVTRDEYRDWWRYFMRMAANNGFRPYGVTDAHGAAPSSLHLWKGTAPLGYKMLANPDAYLRLPAVKLNDEPEVVSTLKRLNEPACFAEVLVGEAWEKMCKSKAFIGAFSTDSAKNNAEGALASIMITLQRSKPPA